MKARSLVLVSSLLAATSALPFESSSGSYVDILDRSFATRAIAAVNGTDQYPTSLDQLKDGNTTCATSNGGSLADYDQPLYTEAHRPQLHFSPSENFMNDPNGLIYSQGLWHLFYQYNPTEPVAGNQHWGHAISKDLYHWQNLPMAIAPEDEGEGIFSGSAVLDVNNTSGLFEESTPADMRFVAVYTLNTPTEQTQRLAYSSDGITFTKLNQTLLTINSTQFRDPKVMWDDSTKQWVMTVAHPQEFAVTFYGSPDLKAWTELSKFKMTGLPGYQYECPDLVQIPIESGPDAGKLRWVLVNSINPGSPMGGSIVQYYVGNWDGKAFTADDAAFRYADFGKDYYAFQSWSNAPGGKAYGVAWASNWQYTNVAPTSPFRSVQSLPRELTLKYYRPNPMYGDLVLSSKPALLDGLKNTTLFSLPANDAAAAKQNHTVDLVGDGAFEIDATFSLPTNANVSYHTIGSFEIQSTSGSQSIVTGIQMGEPTQMYIDRSNAGREWAKTNPFFTDKSSGIVRYAANYTAEQHVLGPLPTDVQLKTDKEGQNTISLKAVVDRSILEAWANDGELSGTSVFFFDNDEKPAKVVVSIGDDVLSLQSLTVKHIDSAWPKCS